MVLSRSGLKKEKKKSHQVADVRCFHQNEHERVGTAGELGGGGVCGLNYAASDGEVLEEGLRKN